MATARTRPTSPHLTIWKWGPHMAVSIAHRVMGVGLATVGTAAFVWWLAALASGPAAYAGFLGWAKWPPAWIIPVGLSFAFFLHMSNGIRHFFMDMGANFELKGNRMSARAVFVAAAVLTAVTWAYIFFGKA